MYRYPNGTILFGCRGGLGLQTGLGFRNRRVVSESKRLDKFVRIANLELEMEDDVLAANTSPLRVTLNQKLLQILGFITDAKSEPLKQVKLNYDGWW